MGYIPHVHWAYDYLGPFGFSGYIWLDTKIVFKKMSATKSKSHQITFTRAFDNFPFLGQENGNDAEEWECLKEICRICQHFWLDVYTSDLMSTFLTWCQHFWLDINTSDLISTLLTWCQHFWLDVNTSDLMSTLLTLKPRIHGQCFSLGWFVQPWKR